MRAGFHHKSPFSPYSKRRLAEMVINAIPNDGCVMVFNVRNPNAFRQAVSRICPGVLEVHYCEKLADGEIPPPTRDLYICWREDS